MATAKDTSTPIGARAENYSELELALRQLYSISVAYQDTGYVETAPRDTLAGAMDAMHEIIVLAYSHTPCGIVAVRAQA